MPRPRGQVESGIETATASVKATTTASEAVATSTSTTTWRRYQSSPPLAPDDSSVQASMDWKRATTDERTPSSKRPGGIRFLFPLEGGSVDPVFPPSNTDTGAQKKLYAVHCVFVRE